MPMNWDIVRRIKKDFPASDVDAAIEVLERASAEIPRWCDRLSRCALYIAHGDLERLRLAISIGKSDWRDLIVGAEYKGMEHIRDLFRRFGREKIRRRRWRRR